MEIQFSTNRYKDVGELTIYAGDGMKVVQQVSQLRSASLGHEVPEFIIENFISTVFDMTRFNSTSDIEVVKKIIDAFLNTNEQRELLAFLEQQPL